MFLASKSTSANQENFIPSFANIPFVFDVWSIGSILIEILSGFPLWLSLKSRVLSLDGRSIVNYGIFGVSGRDNTKIFKKQNALFGDKGGSQGISNLKASLKKNYDWSGTNLFDNLLFN